MTLRAQDHLETLFILDRAGRIISTREPDPRPGPDFFLVRRTGSVAWAANALVDDEIAVKLSFLAENQEPNFNSPLPPEWWDLTGNRGDRASAFEFPEDLEPVKEAVLIDDVELLNVHFRGWTANEIPSRWPIMGIFMNGAPISVCHSSRFSDCCAEAGVETAEKYRGRGLAGRVTRAWAAAIRASGRTPIYSVDGDNHASLAVAEKLELIECASYWSLYTQLR